MRIKNEKFAKRGKEIKAQWRTPTMDRGGECWERILSCNGFVMFKDDDAKAKQNGGEWHSHL